jgi:hypothetical protein
LTQLLDTLRLPAIDRPWLWRWSAARTPFRMCVSQVFAHGDADQHADYGCKNFHGNSNFMRIRVGFTRHKVKRFNNGHHGQSRTATKYLATVIFVPS